MMPLASLRARLLWMVLGATFLIWSIAAIASYYQALHEADELMDGQLAQAANLLLAQAERETNASLKNTQLIKLQASSHPYEQMLMLQVWHRPSAATKQLLLHSAGTPALPLFQSDKPGYFDILHATQPWRLFSAYSADQRFFVQVAHPTQDRQRVALEVAEQLAIPILLAFPVLALLVYFAVVRGMRPLDQLAKAVGERSPDNLEVLSPDNILRETLPLTTALNRLLTRLRQTLDNERRFTADAAHELRTPLAGVKVQAQVALASTHPADHQHALRQVLAGADRAARLVEQLLRLARLDPLASLPNPQPVDLSGLAIELVASLQSQANDRQQHLRFITAATPVEVLGEADLLRVALRNLIENALRYTPEQGEITLGTATENGHATLWVRDSGFGVKESELPRLVERFYRGELNNIGNNTTQNEGSGLGLAIVQRIAELHAARLHITNLPTGGLEARLSWY